MRSGLLSEQSCFLSCSHSSHRRLQHGYQSPILGSKPFAIARPCCRRRNATLEARAYGLALSSAGTQSIAGNWLSSFSLVIGAFGLAYFLSQDQKKQEEPKVECSTCEGTGQVPCVCNRWSDGDRGCSICGGSGYMACPSCGGGGTAVPIALKVTAPSRQRNMVDGASRLKSKARSPSQCAHS